MRTSTGHALIPSPITNLVVFAILALGLVIGNHEAADRWQSQPGSDWAVATGSPEDLIAKHHCHTDSIHDGDTSAVISLPGSAGPVWTKALSAHKGERLFTEAVFDSLPAGSVVHAFC